MDEKQIKLVKLEGFAFELDGKKLQEGMFSWSGNYVLKLRVSVKDKKVYATLYYANKDYRIEKHKKKKTKEEKPKVIDVIEEIIKNRGENSGRESD